eukprot:4780709-Prorocentrum_lima.AAC.1
MRATSELHIVSAFRTHDACSFARLSGQSLFALVDWLDRHCRDSLVFLGFICCRSPFPLSFRCFAVAVA